MTDGHCLRRTPLYEVHLALGARMVPFAGWEMPLEYGSILAEHRAVRERAGLFDVSHMGEVAVEGPGARGLLQRLLSNDVARLPPGRALYTLMCREDGGTVDDLIVLCRGDERFLLVVNAANREKDVRWIAGWAEGASGAAVRDVSDRWALLALQGPAAEAVLAGAAGAAGEALSRLRPFGLLEDFPVDGVRCLVSRTGYTGEDGFELFCRPEEAAAAWERLLAAGRPLGLQPAGLGARDTLRLEAALPLYGHELSEEINPYEARLDRFVRLDKGDFVGREALARVRAQGPRRLLAGLVVRGRGGVPRAGYAVLAGGRRVGEVTSGSFSPTLGRGIALALVEPAQATPGRPLGVEGRDRLLAAETVALPFYRRAAAGGAGATGRGGA